MGVTAPLSSALIRACVAEDATRRQHEFSQEAITAIQRYGAPVGSRIERFARHSRCMDHARELIRRHEQEGRSFPSGSVLLANELTAGKGRFQRFWHAPPGGLWLTLILVNTLLPEHTRLYPLAAGVACCETVRRHGIDARLKWVNDLHVGGRKLAGILTETERGQRFGEEYILIGIGLNVNNEDFPVEIAPLATSMKQLTGATFDLDLLAAQLLAQLSWNIGLLHHREAEELRGDDPDAQPFHPLLARWLQLSDSIGRRVLFGFDVQQAPQYEATVQELDASGGLVLKLAEDGSVIVEHAGEILYLDDATEPRAEG